MSQPIVAPIWGVALGAVLGLALIGGGAAYALRGGGEEPALTPTAVPIVLVTATPRTGRDRDHRATAGHAYRYRGHRDDRSGLPRRQKDRSKRQLFQWSSSHQPPNPSLSRRIMFAANIGTGLHTLEMMTIGSDGSDPQQLTDNQWDDWGAQWSPDGLGITYIEQIFPVGAETNSNVYIMNADGSDKRPVTRFPGMNEWPLWSPDGLKILYSTRRDGNNEIHVFDLTTNTDTNVSDFEGGDYTPYWAPDSASGHLLLRTLRWKRSLRRQCRRLRRSRTPHQ